MGFLGSAKRFATRTLAHTGTALRQLSDISNAVHRTLSGSTGMLKGFSHQLANDFGAPKVGDTVGRILDTVNQYSGPFASRLKMASDLLAP